MNKMILIPLTGLLMSCTVTVNEPEPEWNCKGKEDGVVKFMRECSSGIQGLGKSICLEKAKELYCDRMDSRPCENQLSQENIF